MAAGQGPKGRWRLSVERGGEEKKKKKKKRW
jgi:hypothetical protein